MASFAYQVKNELVRQALLQRCCAKSELKAFLQMSGKLSLKARKARIIVETQNASVARRLFLLFKYCFEVPPEILLFKKNHLQKNSNFLLQVTDKNVVFQILEELGFLQINPAEGRVKTVLLPGFSLRSANALKGKCCRRAYLRGAFLASGSLNDPRTTEYHLEIVAPYETYARSIKNVMSSFNLEARYFQRKNDYVVYLKGAEEIGEFLRIIAAHNALLQFEDIRVVKGVRNRINRLVNCETANLTKTVFASLEQINNIRLIDELVGLRNIEPSLYQVAQLRLRYPEASLQELGNLAVPPLSKSSVNHRLRRINSLARKLKEDRPERN